MRKLELKDYVSHTKRPDPFGKMLDIQTPYYVRDSINTILFNPALQLTSAELVKQNVLAMKLESCKEDTILLEDAEYDRIKKALDIFKGWGRADVELVLRINDAEVVEVKPK